MPEALVIFRVLGTLLFLEVDQNLTDFMAAMPNHGLSVQHRLDTRKRSASPEQDGTRFDT